jgi:hypothetical protein
MKPLSLIIAFLPLIAFSPLSCGWGVANFAAGVSRVGRHEPADAPAAR